VLIAGNSTRYDDLRENTEKRKKYKKVKVQCECGCMIRRSYISTHKKSQKHIQLMNQTNLL